MCNERRDGKLIRRPEEFFLAEALIDLKRLTTKPLSTEFIWRLVEQAGKLIITKKVKQITYRFLSRLYRFNLIEPYNIAEGLDLPIRFRIFTVKDECVKNLQEEIDDFRSKFCK